MAGNLRHVLRIVQGDSPVLCVPRPSIASLGAARAGLERLLDTAHESSKRARQGDTGAHARSSLLLHQAAGTLSMLELHDAAQLARDMGLVIEGEQSLHSAEEALEAAFRVLARYPAYVCERREARPELLRPESDALRALGGLETLPDASFLLEAEFSGCHCPAHTPTVRGEEELPRRLRHLYQLGLLAVVRRRFDPIHVHMMRRASDRMLDLAGGGEAGERWWLLGAVLEGIANGALRATPERIRTLRAGDGWLRAWTRDPERRGDPLNTEQRGTLLTLIARAGSGQRIAEIRALYDLALTLPDDETLARERRRLLGESDTDMAATILLVQTEFCTVRRVLDAVAPDSAVDDEVLDEVGAALQRAVQALTDCGLTDAAIRLEAQSAQTGHCRGTGTGMAADMLQQLANVVVEVEVALNDFAHAHGIAPPRTVSAFIGDTLAQARSQALAQARECLELVKREFAVSVDSGGSTSRSPVTLRHELDLVRGALLMLGHPGAAAIAVRALGLLSTAAVIAPDEDSASAEHLADVLIGLEYCIASLQAGDEPDRRILDLARVSTPSRGDVTGNDPASIGMC